MVIVGAILCFRWKWGRMDVWYRNWGRTDCIRSCSWFVKNCATSYTNVSSFYIILVIFIVFFFNAVFIFRTKNRSEHVLAAGCVSHDLVNCWRGSTQKIRHVGSSIVDNYWSLAFAMTPQFLWTRIPRIVHLPVSQKYDKLMLQEAFLFTGVLDLNSSPAILSLMSSDEIIHISNLVSMLE